MATRKAVVALVGLWLSGAAAGTTYTYVGPTYTNAGSPYTTAMSVTGTFDTAAPLPANMPDTNIGPDGSGLVTAWSFFDGVNTLTQANSSPLPFSFNVTTDAEGNITAFSITLLSPQPPNTVGELVNSIEIALPAGFGTVVLDAATCNSLFVDTNICDNWGSTTQAASSIASGSFTPNFTAIAPAIAKAFAPSSLPPNGTTSLTLTLTNPNLVAPLTGVAFTDAFPAGMLVATPNGLANTCGGIATAVQGTGSVSVAGATIASNSSCTLTVKVTTTSTGSFTNTTGPVTSSNSLPGNTASATLGVVAPPAPIPTMQPWALLLSGLVLAISGAGVTGRRRSTASRRRGAEAIG